jgi:2-desacetyl-2-hydroxyethyl bacteriochlorophyllide A dehydrogenase
MIKALRSVMPEPFKVVTEEYDVNPDAVPAGHVLIQTEASAVSAGTELAVYTGVHQWLNDPTRTWPRFPFVPGYSGVGRIIRTGAGVQTFKVGDRVIYPARHESHTVVNLNERSNLILPIADHVPAQVAAVAVLARFPLAALTQTREMLGQCVAVLGLGMIGQITVRLFSAAGAFPIIGVDSVIARRGIARRTDGVVTASPDDAGLHDTLRIHNDGNLPDVVVEATGNPQAVKLAMNIVADGGKVVMVGSPRGVAGEVNFYWDLHGRSIQLIGAHGSAIGAEPREKFSFVQRRAMRLLIHLLESGKLVLDDLISHHVHGSELGAMYDGLLNRKEEHLLVTAHWE